MQMNKLNSLLEATRGSDKKDTSNLTITGADPGFGQGGLQVLRLKVADIAKQSHTSEVSNLWLGLRAA